MGLVRTGGFTQNQLKMIAAAAMAIDHVGAELFPQLELLRVIGRLAFPIFSYFISEGFWYTRDKRRYFLRVALLGAACTAVYYLYSGVVYGNVLITFSASIVILYGFLAFRQRMGGSPKQKGYGILILAGSLLGVCLLCTWMEVDYGIFGVLLPLLAVLAGGWGETKKPVLALAGFAAGLLLLAVQMGGIQFYSLASVPLLAAYSGQRGSWNMKAFFYWFYPLHLALIGMIAQLVF